VWWGRWWRLWQLQVLPVCTACNSALARHTGTPRCGMVAVSLVQAYNYAPMRFAASTPCVRLQRLAWAAAYQARALRRMGVQKPVPWA
jgi:hypothetical protein